MELEELKVYNIYPQLKVSNLFVINENGVNKVVLVDYINIKTNLLHDKYNTHYTIADNNKLKGISEESKTVYNYGEILYYIYSGKYYNNSYSVSEFCKKSKLNDWNLYEVISNKFILLLFVNIIYNYEKISIGDLKNCIFIIII